MVFYLLLIFKYIIYSNFIIFSILIILSLEVIEGPLDGVIGNPQNIEQLSQTKSAVQVQAKPQPNNPPQNNQQQKLQPKPQQTIQQRNTMNTPSNSTQSKNIFPIHSLNPYQKKWTIKARVTRKGEMKTWKNKNGEGQLFSVDFVDSQGGEIRATCFKDTAKKFFPIFEENKVYLVSHGQIKFADQRFNPLSHEYEITLDNSSTVELCSDDNAIPTVQYNFERIANLTNAEGNSVIDLIGVVSQVGEIANITSKSGNELTKRDIFVADDTGASIKLTLWSDKAVSFSSPPGTIIAIKGARVSDYGGKSLSLVSSSKLEENPDLPEAHRLRGWFDETGGVIYQVLTQDFVPGSGTSGPLPKKTFGQLKTENLGVGQPFKFSNRATVLSIPDKDTFCYPACPGKDPKDPTRNCNKKVNEMNGQWVCDKCDGTFPQPKLRYILSACCSDATGHTWLTLFDDVAQQILGQPAEVIAAWKEEGNDDAVTQLYKSATFQTFNMKLVAKEEIYEGDSRIKCSLQSVTPINFVEESRNLIAAIQELTV